MKTVILLVLLTASLASAQVAGLCGAGKHCRAASFTAEGGLTVNNVGLIATPKNRSTGGICIPSSNGTVPAYLFYRTSTKFQLYACSLIDCSACATTMVEWDNGGGGGQRWPGVAAASLPACTAGLAGTVQYDTTNSALRLCNGSAWTYLVSPTIQQVAEEVVLTGFASSPAGADNTVFQSSTIFTTGPGTNTTLKDFTVTIHTAGTVGGTFTIDVYDNTGASVVCTTAAISCTAAAGTVTLKSCGNAITANRRFDLRYQMSGCTGTRPIINVAAEFTRTF